MKGKLGIYKTSLCCLLGLLLLTGCKKDDVVTTTAFVDPNLQSYFEAFESVALDRGIVVDLTEAGIEGLLLPLNEGSVIGKCSYSAGSKQVSIDSDYWRTANQFEKELVVFHELGHCFLGRNHLDTANPDGSCTSIMHSGLTNCRSNYNSVTRARYLDELFE